MIDINELRTKTHEIQKQDKAKEFKRLTDKYTDLIKDTEHSMRKAAADGRYSITVSNIPKDAINALYASFPKPFKKTVKFSDHRNTVTISWKP